MSATIPSAPQQSTLSTPDGRGLHLRRWGDTANETALVVVHGLGEHSGWYGELGDAMASSEVTTYAYDQHGHGKSPGVRGHAPSLDRFIDDVQCVCEHVADRQPDAEIVLLGHSMGGHITLRFLLDRNRPPINRAIVTNPMILPKNPPTKAQSFAAWLTAKVIPRVRLSADIKPSQLTQDAEMLARLAADPLLHEKLSIGIGGELMSSGHEILEQADQLRTPLLFLIGEDDEICDAETSKAFCTRSGECCTTKRFHGLRHSLLLETRRDAVLDTIAAWISRADQARDAG
ncbi:alpha/beta hydrolase [Rhodopirellula sp. JC639]|uniref:alpha/beta hydrolase n=1 Tax=Stieleria mannarensis TaxID=2755585 RepID=UPI0016016701|nr:alpha/beta hydrolase [Rhodopirellula sp. JC639]